MNNHFLSFGFFSISHKREDEKEAKRLLHALEYYHLPKHLWQENPDLPEYVRIVFCDHIKRCIFALEKQL